MTRTKDIRVLAIDPSTRGFGFAMFEGPKKLVDWGGRTARVNKNAECLAKVKELITLYRPQVIVVEDCEAKGSRRCGRVKDLIRSITALAKAHKIRVRSISRLQVKQAFASEHGTTKDRIARIIVKSFHELADRVPRARKAWTSEGYGMSIFDAVALGMAYFNRRAE